MDDLINTLNNFKLGLSGIDDIISRLDNLTTQDSNYEWEQLVANYSKMKFLERMEPELSCSINLINSLNRFMEQMDKVSQYYIREIDWTRETDFRKEGAEIENYLSESINHNDPFKKLRFVINGYDILIPLVEGFREEKFVEEIEDEEFVQIFKKRKLN